MPEISHLHLLGAFGAAFLAGGINSVAGGGSMISFPILMALGLPPLIANATNTAGIWSGAIGSLWGFRRELARVPKPMHWFLLPAIIGGIVGALLLRVTAPDVFNRIVPFLILFATLLFIGRAPIQRRLMARTGSASHSTTKQWWIVALVLQLIVAIYGGYFGAGMSIMMLSILAVIGMTDILEMSAMTSLLSLAINGVAGLIFIASGLVAWPFVAVMAVGAIMGGYLAAGLARKIGKVLIQRFVIAVGLTLAAVMFIKIFLAI
jgi:uncharacterized membrane protein YfcA